MYLLGRQVAAVLLCFSAGAAVAQSHRPVPIEPLLRNEEPRLVALGAWEVIKRQDDAQINLLIDLAERWDSRANQQNGEGQDAMAVVLDALIQRQASVSPAAILAVAHDFPNQALILTARMDPNDADPILRSWYQAGRGRWRAERNARDANQLLARIAAMFLARNAPDEIAASVVEDSAAQLLVSVPDATSAGVEHCLLGCEAPRPCAEETMEPGRAGWPPVFAYSLEENDPDTRRRNGILIYAGGDTITWRRVEAEVQQDHCYAPEPLTAETRHHLLAEMLRVRDADLPWGAQMRFIAPWSSDEAWLRDLAGQVREEEQTLYSTVRALHAKGLLTESQFQTVRPRLTVVVFDDRERPAEPRQALRLPQPRDSRTTCRLAPAS